MGLVKLGFILAEMGYARMKHGGKWKCQYCNKKFRAKDEGYYYCPYCNNKNLVGVNVNTLRENGSIDDLRKVGIDLVANEMYSTACPVFLQMITKFPNLVDTNDYILLGQCYFYLNDYSSAYNALNTAIQKNPRNIIAITTLSMVYIKTNQLDYAERILLNGLQYANDEKIYAALSTVYVKQKRFQEAEKALLEAMAIKYDPDLEENLTKIRILSRRQEMKS